MTEPTTCSKCGGIVQKITTPIQHESPADARGVIQRQTVAVDYHYRCRQCGKESAMARNMLDAIANWDLNMKYRIQYASKTNDDWDTFITVYASLEKARKDMDYMRLRGENYVFKFRIIDQNGKVVE